MTSSFDRWEKDPFFSAAEEIQESADRMESTYRTWMHSKEDNSSMWNSDELRRDLRTALGTAEWQLDDFQRAVSSSYIKSSSKDARDRHREFIVAIQDQISNIEHSLQECSILEGKPPSSPWVQLDEGECDELELFLSGSSAFGDNKSNVGNNSGDEGNRRGITKEMTADCLKSSNHVVMNPYRHRRTASACTDIGAWKIATAGVNCLPDGTNGLPPRKVPSFSGFLSSMDYAPSYMWPKNGVRKWKAMYINQEAAPLHSSHLTEGIHACYEKSKSSLDGCDECYNKQLYGWYGVLQRQVQRSRVNCIASFVRIYEIAIDFGRTECSVDRMPRALEKEIGLACIFGRHFQGSWTGNITFNIYSLPFFPFPFCIPTTLHFSTPQILVPLMKGNMCTILKAKK